MYLRLRNAKSSACNGESSGSPSSSVKTEEYVESEEEEILPKPKRARKKKETVVAKPRQNATKCLNVAPDRLNRALQHFLDILKAEGAVFSKPMSRCKLRQAARCYIGDTGLLDQLLKHINGKVAPNGVERFKRWYNPHGNIEYWLESADLDHIRQEAGVQNPYWIPPSEDVASASDVKLIKDEVINIKRELKEFMSEQKDQNHVNSSVEAMHKELKNLHEKINQLKQCDVQRSCSLIGLQKKYQEFTQWQESVGKQITDLRDSMSNIQVAMVVSQPLGQHDLFGSNQEEDEQANWMKLSDPDHVEGEVELCSVPSQNGDQNGGYASELAMLRNEVAMIKRDMKELQKPQDDITSGCKQATSLDMNPQLEHENPLLSSQKWKEMTEWRTKVDQQMEWLLNTVRSMQATNPSLPFNSTFDFYR